MDVKEEESSHWLNEVTGLEEQLTFHEAAMLISMETCTYHRSEIGSKIDKPGILPEEKLMTLGLATIDHRGYLKLTDKGKFVAVIFIEMIQSVLARRIKHL